METAEATHQTTVSLTFQNPFNSLVYASASVQAFWASVIEKDQTSLWKTNAIRTERFTHYIKIKEMHQDSSPCILLLNDTGSITALRIMQTC